MNRNLIVVLMIILAFFVYKKMNANPFLGDWKSDKELTLKEFENSNISIVKRKFFEKQLGKMTFTISENEWNASFDGNIMQQTYEIQSSNGECHYVKTFDKGQVEDLNICFKDDNKMYIPIKQLNGAKEVFVRI